MPSWGDVLANHGTLITPAFTIIGDKNSYLFHLDIDAELNNGSIDAEYSVSYDGYEWADWQTIFDKNAFVVDNAGVREFQIKFKLIFNTTDLSKSPILKSVIFTSNNVHKVTNIGDLKCKPRLWIKKKNNDGDISIHNLENQKVLQFTNLKKDEVVYVDCENEDIVTSLPLTYRYDDHNDVFIEFLEGDNHLYGEGDFDLSIKFQSKLLV